MSVDVLTYLVDKGLNPRRAPGDEVHVACPFCDENPSKRGRMYVNVNPTADILGLFHCKLCDHRGSLVSLQRHYGDATEKQEQEDTGYIRRVLLAEAATFYHDNLSNHPEVLGWLKNERGLALDTIIDHQIGYADGGLMPVLRGHGFTISDIVAAGLASDNRETGRVDDFLRDRITIPYHVSGNVVMIRGRAYGENKGPKYVTGTGQKSRLYNTDSTWSAEEVVITEGELDALVVEQLGFNAVAVPGANTWQDSWDGYFTDARRVYVVFDNDDAGAKGATKVVDRLGPKARMVTMPAVEFGQPKNDPTQWIAKEGHTADDFADLLRATRGGLLVTVDEAIAEHASLQNQAGLKLGIHMLDQQLAPGILPSQLMICLANTGVGKTIFLLNIFYRVCQAQPDAKILFFSLEQTRGDWWERARRIYRFFHMGATDQDAYHFWRDRIMLVDSNRVTEDQLIAGIDDFTEEWDKPALVAVDYLGYFARSYKGDQYTRTSEAVMSLKAVAKEKLLAVVSPSQVSRGTQHGNEPSVNAARDSGAVEETGDFVLSLWSEDNKDKVALAARSGEFKVTLQKSRHGGVGHVETMWFAPLSLAIVDRGRPEHRRWANDEIYYQANYGAETWEHALMRHEAGLGKFETQLANVEAALWKKRQGQMS